MPRRPRNEEAGAIHHVYARGVAKREIFRDDADRQYYLLLLDWVVQRTGWLVLAYCLMDNHIHLLVETPEPNLGRGMRRLHGDYARSFNERFDLSGHVFQGRYESKRMTSDPHLLVATRYVVRNPVEAGLCDDPAAWHWSSHRAVVTAAAPRFLAAERLLGYFAAFGGEGLDRYSAFVSRPDSIEAPAHAGAEASDAAVVPGSRGAGPS
jgi:REP element-mobilizing transposase RayT